MKVKQIEIVKLTPAERETAKRTFAMMAEIFGEDSSPLGDGYLEKLLGKDQFWAFAALIGDEVVGGATAHVLPMRRAEVQELFIYDIAVASAICRNGSAISGWSIRGSRVGGKSGVWEKIFRHLAQEADNEYALIDSTIVRAHEHSAGARKKTAKSKLSGAAEAD